MHSVMNGRTSLTCLLGRSKVFEIPHERLRLNYFDVGNGNEKMMRIITEFFEQYWEIFYLNS